VTTKTVTVAGIIAQHGPMIAHIDQTTPDPDLTPEGFINLLQENSRLLATSSSSRFQETAEELASAATYLADALTLPDDDPQQQTLLNHANRRLNRIDPYL